jgi:hypothetical protein
VKEDERATLEVPFQGIGVLRKVEGKAAAFLNHSDIFDVVYTLSKGAHGLFIYVKERFDEYTLKVRIPSNGKSNQYRLIRELIRAGIIRKAGPKGTDFYMVSPDYFKVRYDPAGVRQSWDQLER